MTEAAVSLGWPFNDRTWIGQAARIVRIAVGALILVIGVQIAD